MIQLIIHLAQSVTSAVLSVIGLGLVAVAIGYATAWFYAKSIYTPIIKGLEAEKADLQKQVAGLKEDIRKLNEKIESLNLSIAGLEKDLKERDKLLAEKDRQINELKNPKK